MRWLLTLFVFQFSCHTIGDQQIRFMAPGVYTINPETRPEYVIVLPAPTLKEMPTFGAWVYTWNFKQWAEWQRRYKNGEKKWW